MKMSKKPSDNLPPGPPRLPIIGNLHQLGNLPHRSLRSLSQKYGPVMLLRLGQIPTLIVSSPETAKQVLKTHDLECCCSRPFSRGPKRLSYNLLDLAFGPYSDYWREMRKLCMIELFTVKRSILIPQGQKSSEHEDITDILLGLSKDETASFRLTKDHIKAILMDIFIGAIDTSSLTLEENHKISENDLGKLKYLKMVVKETFRLHPQATLLIPRESIQHCQIGGYDVYPKTWILVNAWAIGRDPGTWANPDVFYPDRFEGSEIDFKGQNFELLPFGAGRRICPGLTMGATVVEFTLANLLHFFDWKMPSGMKREQISLEEEAGLTVHKKLPLYLVPEKYNWEDYKIEG
ncbi:cytochrome P450, family 71, subfamily B, polypeptide 20 [Actinidia rufa]|uniref:Cytochrome P450, family 71, subfamily B, polypeptide 20 n=1 Tax=Actinidia rufa TaxID=165716 RepID=A0A7J0HA71_9ERIC|nr:cytochrome P450, family 71, subfamily B, polypeptide 20 [Actinidia rufa]